MPILCRECYPSSCITRKGPCVPSAASVLLLSHPQMLSVTLNFCGVIAATFGPAIVLSAYIIAKRPVLIILSVFAAFLWLCSITVVATSWWLLVPLRNFMWLLLLYAVAVQELCRWGTYALFERFMRGLQSAGLLSAASPRATPALSVPAACASGLGVGVMQALVTYGDVLVGARQPGTFYTPYCSGFSVFAVDALSACAFIVLNVLLSVVGWAAAYPRASCPMCISIVGLHYAASGSTLMQSAPIMPLGEGCALALPSLAGVVATAGVVAGVVVANSAWKLGEA